MASELFDAVGNRKYLSQAERDAFMSAASHAPRDVRTFCALLHYSGCRLTEALELTYDRIDLSEGTVVFETLKNRLTYASTCANVSEAVAAARASCCGTGAGPQRGAGSRK